MNLAKTLFQKSGEKQKGLKFQKNFFQASPENRKAKNLVIH